MMQLKDLENFFKRTQSNERIVVHLSDSLKVMVTTCVHRFLDPDTAFNILQLTLCPTTHFFWSNRKGDALIDRSRSIEATRFLHSNCDVMLFIDDDIIFKPEDAIKICNLAKEKESIAGAAYILKTEGDNHITSKIFPNQEIMFEPNSKPVEVYSVATGFMAIHKKVLEKMLIESRNFNDESPYHIPLCHPKSFPFYPFFSPFPKQVEGIGWCYLSEDWAFCERWNKIGGKCWLDPSIRIGHAGRKVYDLDDLCVENKKHNEIIRYKEPEVVIN